MIVSMNQIERLDIDAAALRTFLAVAEAGNVTHAAAALGRTQSAVSVQLRKLEAALAVRLFDRRARGMGLTEAGETLLPAARRALAEVERIAGLFAQPLSGRIRVGIPDDYWGEAVKAVVSLHQGASATAEELIEFCAGKLAGYKRPKSLEIWDDLPKNATGKLLRRKVREKYWEGMDRSI